MKKIFIIIGSILLGLLLFVLSLHFWVNYNKSKEQIPVLMYHQVVPDEFYEPKPDTISSSVFEEQLKYFRDNNIKTLSLEEFYCWKIGDCNIEGKAVLLTFDDGFYSFHYIVKPLLEKYDSKAVCFVIGNTVEEKTKEYDVNKYGTIGMDIINEEFKNVDYQSHSYGLHKMVSGKQMVYTLTKKELQEDFDKMKEIKNFEYMSYPFNTDTDEIMEVLKENGYKLAFRGEAEKATKTANNYQIPRIGVTNDLGTIKTIFETDNYNNKYGNGLIRKVFVTLERKLRG